MCSSTQNNQAYTGRLAAGMISMFDEMFAATGELGWGYYGRTSLNPNSANFILPGSLSISDNLSGFDALLGIAFTQPSYNFFIKAGALIQNMRTTTTANNFAPLEDTADYSEEKTNRTAVMPEIKIGGAYNFTNNWAITAAYMFALGSSPQTTGNYNVFTGTSSLNVNNQNPTLNTVLLGVQYTI